MLIQLLFLYFEFRLSFKDGLRILEEEDVNYEGKLKSVDIDRYQLAEDWKGQSRSHPIIPDVFSMKTQCQFVTI